MQSALRVGRLGAGGDGTGDFLDYWYNRNYAALGWCIGRRP